MDSRERNWRARPVIAAEVSLKFIWDVVSRIRIGAAGHAYVVDSAGHLIAHPDIAWVLQDTDVSALPQVRAAREGRERGGTQTDASVIATGLDGAQVLTTHYTIDELGWWVFAQQPLEEAFAPVYASAARSGVLILIGLSLSVLASMFLARHMVQPVRALQAGAARIAAGELDQRLSVHTCDELEALAEEFNHMAAALRDSYAGWSNRSRCAPKRLATPSSSSRTSVASSKPPAATSQDFWRS